MTQRSGFPPFSQTACRDFGQSAAIRPFVRVRRKNRVHKPFFTSSAADSQGRLLPWTSWFHRLVPPNARRPHAISAAASTVRTARRARSRRAKASTSSSNGCWASSAPCWRSASARSRICTPPPRSPSRNRSQWRRTPRCTTPTAPPPSARSRSRTVRSSTARSCPTMWGRPSWPPRTGRSTPTAASTSSASPARSGTT